MLKIFKVLTKSITQVTQVRTVVNASQHTTATKSQELHTAQQGLQPPTN
jgi:hypothetical protein